MHTHTRTRTQAVRKKDTMHGLTVYEIKWKVCSFVRVCRKRERCREAEGGDALMRPAILCAMTN